MDDLTTTAAPPDFSGIARTLEKTQPWVRLMSVLAFIGVAFMAAAGLIGGVAGLASGDATMILLMVIYPLFALLYLFPAIFMWRYASRIGDFVRERTTPALESALDAQRSFWKFTGIMVIVSFALGILAAVAIGVFAAASVP